MNLFQKYKSVWLFLIQFFGVYIFGVYLYNQYLGLYLPGLDVFSIAITQQLSGMFSLTLPEITTYFSAEEPLGEVHYYEVPFVLINEGCNAISVMILFVSFIVAFKGSLRHYVWFIPAGLVLLYVANITRIYLIGLIYLYYPSYVNLAHDYLFPGIIYGTTFLLWVVWVKYFSINSKELKNG